MFIQQDIFALTADFDPGTGVFNLVSAATSQDVFISKLDNAGNFVWAKSIGGPAIEYAFSIATDPQGNSYTTGTFGNTVDFDPDATGVYNLTCGGTTGYYNAFVLKLNSSGNFVWAKQFKGANFVHSNAIALDNNGNVYTTGSFNSTADFNPDTFGRI